MKKKSTVLDGFFPYLTQMFTSMRGCVAYNDLWPWPISSRSFGLGLENRVRSVASTVPDGVFPYLVQMITSMRRCVACDDLWPWPISSRSFDLDLENRVRSVASAVLDRFIFLYLAQMITFIRGCAVCYFFLQNLEIWIFGKFLKFSAVTLKKNSTVLDGFFPYLAQIIISIRGCVACNDLWPWPIFSRTIGLDLENRVPSVRLQFWMDSFHMWYKWSLAWGGALHVMTLTYIFKVFRPCFDLGDPTWLNNVGNHEAAGGILRTQAF